jgi:hypothetical protein
VSNFIWLSESLGMSRNQEQRLRRCELSGDYIEHVKTKAMQNYFPSSVFVSMPMYFPTPDISAKVEGDRIKKSRADCDWQEEPSKKSIEGSCRAGDCWR